LGQLVLNQLPLEHVFVQLLVYPEEGLKAVNPQQ